MKKFINVLLEVLGILSVLILGIVVFTISSNSQKIPGIVVSTSSNKVNALRGNYTWNAFNEVLNYDTHSNDDYDYTNENTIVTSPKEKVNITNSQDVGSRHTFNSKEFMYKDSKDRIQSVTATDVSNTYNNYTTLEFESPETEGTYYYYFTLDYHEKGQVEYSFKLVVSVDPSYDILDLVKYKNTNLGDAQSINEIISILPYSKNVSNLTIIDGDSGKLNIFFDELLLNRSSFINNAIALFTLIPDLNTLKLYSEDTYYIYTREELELLQGRKLSEYVDNPELWQLETFYKDKRFDENNTKYIAIKNVVLDCIDTMSGEKVDAITIDTSSFINYTDFGVSSIDGAKVLDNLKDYASVVYDMSLSKHLANKYKHLYIGAEAFVSGDSITDAILTDEGENDTLPENIEIPSGDGSSSPYPIYKLNIILFKNGDIKRYQYNLAYINGLWEYSRHNSES